MDDPAEKLRVFISSKMATLKDERQTIKAELDKLNVHAWVYEDHAGARPDSIQHTYRTEATGADLYIGLFWREYGQYTIEEYELAAKLGKPCLIYEKRTGIDGRDPQLQAFLDEINVVEHGRSICWFHDLAELAKFVRRDVAAWQTRTIRQQGRTQRILQIPPPPADFTGRGQELEQLLDDIGRPGASGALVSGLRGMGGVGKTALARQAAYQLSADYPGAMIEINLHGDGSREPLASAEALKQIIHIFAPAAQLPEDLESLRGLYAQVLHGRQALLLLDNAYSAAQVMPLLPPPGCAVLVTSRRHFALPDMHSLDLNTLPPEKAAALLVRIAPRVGAQAGEIAAACGLLQKLAGAGEITV